MHKPLPNALDIDFKGGLTSGVTPHAGIALVRGAPAAAGTLHVG